MQSVFFNIILSLLFVSISIPINAQNVMDSEGAIVRTDTSSKSIYLFFTGHELIDGFEYVLNVLDKHDAKGSFFFTGDFIRSYSDLVQEIDTKGHFVGAHSDKHLLYCDWTNRDSLLLSESDIKTDIADNLKELSRLDIHPKYFMAPYEWHNKKVVELASELNQTTVNFSSGTRSNADYTTPDLPNYISSDDILKSIYNYESSNKMNGFHLLIHPGTTHERKDKFYLKLDELITKFTNQGYSFSRL